MIVNGETYRDYPRQAVYAPGFVTPILQPYSLSIRIWPQSKHRHRRRMLAKKGLGRIVERSPTKALSGGPCPPYTRTLLSAIPGREAPEGGARASQGRHGLAPLSLATFWVVMATADDSGMRMRQREKRRLQPPFRREAASSSTAQLKFFARWVS